MEYLVLIAVYVLGISAGYIQRIVMRNMRIRKTIPVAGHKNIGTPDRVFRVVLAVVLGVYGVWTGSEIALLFAGYTTYEAFATWCGFYAVIGRNTCPLN